MDPIDFHSICKKNTKPINYLLFLQNIFFIFGLIIPLTSILLSLSSNCINGRSKMD